MAEALKIAIVGSRGIPAKYGGAETFAEEVSQKLTKLGLRSTLPVSRVDSTKTNIMGSSGSTLPPFKEKL